MAYKIASLTFFNNSEDRVSYSSDNPFLWAIYAGLSFHEPIAPKNIRNTCSFEHFEDFAVELVVNSNHTFHLDIRYSHLKRFIAEVKNISKNFHNSIFLANSLIDNNTSRNELMLFSKYGFFDGGLVHSYSEYRIFHFFCIESNCQSAVKYVTFPLL